MTLRSAVGRTDPVPAAVREEAYRALSWRDPDAELITLIQDSATTTPAAAVRDASDRIRLLTFGSGPITIEIEADLEGDVFQLVGQVVPPGPARLHVQHRGGTHTVNTDEIGQFTALGIRRGPVRLLCELPNHRVETEWILV